ncbi:MAG: arsenate reductase family protein [Saprospiraceae bacterium]
MNTIYLLPSCSTCQRVLKTVEQVGEWTVRDIKSEPLTGAEVDAMAASAGSYEDIFSRRAILYRQRDLKNQTLTEEDYKALILEHYTFLKRPVMQIDDKYFAGSAKKVVEEVVRAV